MRFLYRSTFDFPNDIEKSTSAVQKPVDAAKLEANFTKAESEWQDGTNTDFYISKGKAANFNTDLGGANTIGEAGQTTFKGNIASVDDTGQIDVYNFYIKYPYVQTDIQEQIFYKAGTITSAKAFLGTDATDADFQLNIENAGTVAKATADSHTFEDVTATLQTKTVFDTGSAVLAGTVLSISIAQVGSTLVGQDLRVQVQVTRS